MTGMHLRLPLVAGVVAVAALAAYLRPHGAATPPSAFVTAKPLASAVDMVPARRRQAPQVGAERIVVYVAGDVVRAGLYTLPRRSRAADAVRAAGGARADADLVALNLAAPVADGDEIAVSPVGAREPAGAHRTRRSAASFGRDEVAAKPARHRKKQHARKRRSSRSPGGSVAAGASDGPTDIVDLNSADESELETLPGIGAALAERIVAVRDASGPFVSTDDLLDVGGMTQGRLDAVLPYVVVR